MSAPFILDAPAPRIFSIAPDQNFLEELARATVVEAGEGGAAALADMEIYLPTRRAVRALNDVFLAIAGKNGATILPRIRAIGDVDEEEFALVKGDATAELSLPQTVSDVERRITLARLVAAKDNARGGVARWAGALAAADELAALIDAFHTEEIDPGVLKGIAPDDLADHWARSLEFLDIVTRAWPAYLQEIGRMDAALRRVRLIDGLAERYRSAPPDHPVIVAGTTGSTPAVARLISVVASLPKGAAVLPGVDLSMNETVWRAVDDPHPQSSLKHLLDHGLGVDRAGVRAWPKSGDLEDSARRDVINVALRPAAATDSWRGWAQSFKSRLETSTETLSGLSLVEAEDDEREADAIAIKILEVISAPDQTVFLVTPDRDLSRRVSAKLLRWDIDVDDSAGVPFNATRSGVFLRLIARALSNPADPAAFVAVLRHPLFGGGTSEAKRATAVNAADLALRGLKPDNRQAFEARLSESPAAAEIIPLAEQLFVAAEKASALDLRLMDHVSLAESFAATDKSGGAERLWRGEDGEAGALRVNDLLGATANIDDWAPSDYHDIFDQLIANIAVRRHSTAHRRVAILGPLEARLQAADVIILGGLNEGVWPRDAAIDGFLSRGMRKAIGLPSPERRIGLSAHDFAQLSAAPEVVLTRSKKSGGKPATPSRWLVRLKNILAGAEALDEIDAAEKYAALSARLDNAEHSARPAPRPCPPVNARPTTFFVTRVEALLRDPYAVYARDILRLKPLDPFNEPLDQRHIGTLFHKVFEEYALGAPPSDSDQRVAQLMDLFERHASATSFGAAHLPFWRERAREAFRWFAEWDAARRAEGEPAIVEGRGAWTFDHDGRVYTLSAKADRIDRLLSGAAAIYDYKTGEPPPTDKQQGKFSPQLPLTAAIVRAGGFEELGSMEVDRFAYLRVHNRKGSGRTETGAHGADCVAMIDEAEAGFKTLMTHFNDPNTAYLSQPRPQFVSAYGDYDHLARRRERRAAEDAE